MYLLIDSEAHQFLPETTGFLFHKCISSKEWSIRLELTSEPQSRLNRGVITPQVLMPVFITFLSTQWIQGSVATIDNTVTFACLHNGLVNRNTWVIRDVQLPTKFTNKCDSECATVVTSNIDDFVCGKWECLVTKIRWG